MLSQEELKPLKEIANRRKVGILTFIAQEKAVRLDPTTFATTRISTSEEYELERIIEKDFTDVDSVYLLLHSPGGELTSSYKIALYLRNRFDNITGFVPYAAASGATLMSLGCNQVVLGELGYLTPIDPQVMYRGQRVSTFAIVEMVDQLTDRFAKLTPQEMPVPWRQMADKIDITHYREMQTMLFEATVYARRLLEKAGYDRKTAGEIAHRFTRTPYSHGHCFDLEECEEKGVRVQRGDDFLEDLRTFKTIIHKINEKPADKKLTHIIESAVPDKVSQVKRREEDVTEEVSE